MGRRRAAATWLLVMIGLATAHTGHSLPIKAFGPLPAGASTTTTTSSSSSSSTPVLGMQKGTQGGGRLLKGLAAISSSLRIAAPSSPSQQQQLPAPMRHLLAPQGQDAAGQYPGRFPSSYGPYGPSYGGGGGGYGQTSSYRSFGGSGGGGNPWAGATGGGGSRGGGGNRGWGRRR